LEVALPLLAEHGARAIFFITTDWIGTPGYMDAAGLSALHAAGMLIGAHGCSHRLFSELSVAELRREMADSKKRLEDILGAAVPAMAEPGGRSHPAQRDVAREVGYEHIFTSGSELADPAGDRYAWPRIALINKTPVDFVQRLLKGDDSQLRAMARAERLRRRIKGLMGERFYRALRRRLLGH
jgi:peptidoglycan/xylan/chitin deacetylase (PgdA/CDA1 family)